MTTCEEDKNITDKAINDKGYSARAKSSGGGKTSAHRQEARQMEHTRPRQWEDDSPDGGEQLRRDYGGGGGRGRDAERQPGRQTAGARRRKDVITGWLRGVIQLAAAEVARRKEAAAGFDLGSHCGFGRLGRGGTAIGCG